MIFKILDTDNSGKLTTKNLEKALARGIYTNF